MTDVKFHLFYREDVENNYSEKPSKATSPIVSPQKT